MHTPTHTLTHHLHTHIHTYQLTHTHQLTHCLHTHMTHTPVYIPPAYPYTHQLTHPHTPDIHTDSHTTYTHTHTQAPVGVKLGKIGHHEWAWGRRTSERQPWGSAWKGFSTPRTRWHLQVRERGNVDFFGAYTRTQRGSSLSVTSLLSPGPAASRGASLDPWRGRPLRGRLLHVLGWELAGLVLAHH